ncbi:hypothetical protein [Streptomyces sp. NBC_01443]|uniref:hypothetical protein n=1 Tax=Streptomyces sp. NBC_01443 TaxID=2903868 RepID=UPI002250152C|nr:hypothetical protein [Streptomyces sp. NBC_01443]MCX4632925.1 hypothetical protein [Streptomyces sp. NBC_01443]
MAELVHTNPSEPDNSSSPQQPLTYDEVSEPQFAELAVASFTVEEHEGMTILTGPCPRCGRVFRFPVAAEVFRGPEEEGEEILVYCLSSADFAARPPDRTGCGAYWRLNLV